MSIYALGEHISRAVSPRRKKLTRRQKKVCIEFVDLGHKPARIQTDIQRIFKLDEASTPELLVIQNFVSYYSRKQQSNHDRYRDIRSSVRAMGYTGYEDDDTPFTFSATPDNEGKPTTGRGSDSDPFFVAISTKKMVKRLDRDPASFILHMDATFKLSQVDYPVLVIGISDRHRSFHLVALCVTSQLESCHYAQALASLRRIFTTLTSKALRIQFVMGDADGAQRNAVDAVFGHDSTYQYLMCFFHVLLNLHKRTCSMPKLLSAQVERDVYALHFTTSLQEYTEWKKVVLGRWENTPALGEFAKYFKAQWLDGHFWRWQCFHTLPGYATQNNPCEQFNRRLKGEYTMHSRLKMAKLVVRLSDCCARESKRATEFALEAVAKPKILRRALDMAAQGKLEVRETFQHRTGIGMFVTSGAIERSIPVHAKFRTEEYISVTGRLGVNYARMELAGQPERGWVVDVTGGWCRCRYWSKFGACVHIVHAQKEAGLVNADGDELLVDRRPTRKKKRARLTAPAVVIPGAMAPTGEASVAPRSAHATPAGGGEGVNQTPGSELTLMFSAPTPSDSMTTVATPEAVVDADTVLNQPLTSARMTSESIVSAFAAVERSALTEGAVTDVMARRHPPGRPPQNRHSLSRE
ncbi:hypothetical protein BBJ28_00023230 [Nothophytophthora sp. Chile5]|nr:hypothetical protein BBJ28_00023230 [Nothophytophthora sp. Chile5]